MGHYVAKGQVGELVKSDYSNVGKGVRSWIRLVMTVGMGSSTTDLGYVVSAQTMGSGENEKLDSTK